MKKKSNEKNKRKSRVKSKKIIENNNNLPNLSAAESNQQYILELKEKLQRNPEDNLLIQQLAEYYEKEKEYDLAIEQYKKILTITERGINEVNGRVHKTDDPEAEEALNFADHILHSNFYEIETKISFCYYNQNNYLLAQKGFKKILEKDDDLDLAKVGMAITNFKLKNYNNILEYLYSFRMLSVDEIGIDLYKMIVEIAEYFESINDYARAIELYDRIDPWDYMTYFGDPLRDIISEIYKKHITDLEENTKIRIFELNNKLTESEMDNLKSINKARIEERDKILSNLSHSIKNLISTVIDPLSNLKEEKEYKDAVIDNALKGADLIREIVNAMNLSFKGSINDFKYDAQHNRGNDSLSLYKIIIESLKHSVSNMFDSKYFGNFMRNYFPNQEVYRKAKEAWNKIKNEEDILNFINNYMFKLSFKIDAAQDLVIGNEKGSAIKFQILFQEVILNAIKYTSFIAQDKREVTIWLKVTEDENHFEVSNTFKQGEMTKTTGLGKIIIENFCKLLGTSPLIEKHKDYYNLSINFQNIWSDNGTKK